MATVKTNIWNLQVGDRITILSPPNCNLQAGDRITLRITCTNSVNYIVNMLVKRVEEKSWYATGRNRWGTLQSYSKYADFKIIKRH